MENNLKEQKITLNPTGVKVLEAEDGKGKRLEAILIQSGWSKNGNYYSADVAESVADHVLESKKLYMDHDLSMSGLPRSLKEVAAIAVESRKEDGKAIAVIEMTDNPSTSWLYELAKKFPQEIGLSIDARAKVQEGEIEGKSGRIVEDIIKLNSVDFVTTPSAGGEVTRIAASEEFEKVLNELKSNVERLSSVKEDKKENNHMDDKKVQEKEILTLESVKSNNPEIVKALQEEWSKSDEKDKLVNDYKAQVDDLTSQLSESEGKVKDLEAKVDKYKLVEAEREKKENVDKLLSESDLSESQVSEVFVKTLMAADGEEEIKKHIQDRVEIVNEAQKSGVVEGNGERTTESVEEVVETDEKSEEEVIESWDADSFVNEIKRSNK